MIRFKKLININTGVLRNVVTKDRQFIGNIDLVIQKGDPIITEMFIEKEYRENGYGTKLLNNTEEELFKLGASKVHLNLWSLDRCYFNFYDFYHKRGYSTMSNDNKYTIMDNGENLYYNLNLSKNLIPIFQTKI